MKKVLYILTILIFSTQYFYSQSQFVVERKFPNKYDAFRVVDEDTLIDVFLSSDQQTMTAFQNSLGKISSTYNNITVGSIPIVNFRQLNKNNLEWYTTSKKCFPSLDESQKIINAKLGRDVSGMTGENVIIGIVDDGIDPHNDDFKILVENNNVGRILRIWDQTTDGNPPGGGFSYGYEWSENNIQNCNITNGGVGHGTMVTGIAAGSGLATGNNQTSGKYIGMAPNANIIFVKTTATLPKIIDAVKYINTRAAAYSKPCVINLSLGINLGPRDGTSPFESALDQVISYFNNLVVISAGNTQDKSKHAQKNGAGTVTLNMTETVTDDYYWIEIFYPSSTQYTISIEPPNSNARLYDFTNNIWADGYHLQNYSFDFGEGTGNWDPVHPQGFLCEDGAVGIHNENYSNNNDPYPNTNLRCITIYIDEYTELGVGVKKGDWKIKMTGGTGQWDAYIYNMLDDRIKFTTDVASTGNITEPGSANNVITVGSMNSKNTWMSLAGQIPPQILYPITQKSFFSSEGPTHDGRTKPEIYAPGAWIMSTKSSTGQYTNEYIDHDGSHAIGTGTSYAAPHVTGAAALLLQQNPTWGYNEVKTRLINMANTTYGYPLLDIQAALCKDNDQCKQNPWTPEALNSKVKDKEEETANTTVMEEEKK